MKFERHVRRRVRGAKYDPEEIGLLLARLERAVPYLHFDPWRTRLSRDDEAPCGEVLWKDAGRSVVEVALDLTGIGLAAICRRAAGAISKDDYEFLLNLATEAAQIANASRSAPISVVEFGTSAVAEEVRRRGRLNFDPLAIVQFIRSLGHDTYENQRLSYGVILSRQSGGGALLTQVVDNKRFKRLSDGFSTALVLDRDGRVIKLAALTSSPKEGLLLSRRPWWSAGLASHASQLGGVGIALTRNGDVLVFHRGRLLFSQRAGRWRAWSHAAVLSRIRDLWTCRGKSGNIREVLSYLYHVALDLAFRRSGGLLVVAASRRRLAHLLTSSRDHVGARGRGPGEQTIDRSIRKQRVQNLDRRVVGDLAALDGALVVDRSGHILAFGAMTRSSSTAKQGARTRAAIAASRDGLAIKVSSDGDIAVFAGGRCEFET